MAKKTTKKRTAPKKAPRKKATASTAAGVDFEAAMDGLESAWNDTREQDNTGGSFEAPDIPDGEYVAQLTSARMSAYRRGDRAGTFYVTFRYTIVLGDYKGEVPSSRDDLSTEEIGEAGTTRLQLFLGRLQRMGIDTAKLNIREVPELIQWLVDPKKNKDAKPYYRISVRNNEVPQDDGTVRRYQNVYVNELLDRDEIESQLD